jgi:hypothetical protein
MLIRCALPEPSSAVLLGITDLFVSSVGLVVDGESGVGEEGPGQLSVLVDAVDALFGGVGNIGEVVAGEVSELAFLERRPQQFHRVELRRVSG